MKLKRKTPCKECPFRKTSLPGWLGPWTTQEILAQVHSEGGLACHTVVNKLVEEGVEQDSEEMQERTHVCVGSLQHANASCKRYRHPMLAGWAEEVGTSDQILDLRAFMNHHGEKKRG